MISIAQPVLNPPQDVRKTITRSDLMLFSCVRRTIWPISWVLWAWIFQWNYCKSFLQSIAYVLQAFVPRDNHSVLLQLGVHAYSFMINHNGYLMFHPDLRPVVSTRDRQMGQSRSFFPCVPKDLLAISMLSTRYDHSAFIYSSTNQMRDWWLSF